MSPNSSSSKSEPQVIIAPPSPPCSPSAFAGGLAGYHRAPHYRHPNPHNGRPRPVVQRMRFKPAHPAHPAQPKRPSPSATHRPQDWMMLKLDEDMSDPDMDARSDYSSSDDDISIKPRSRVAESSTPSQTLSASFPRSAPMTIPERRQPQFRSRRKKIGTYHGQTTSYRARMQAPAATSYKESYSYSSDSELDDR